MRNKLCRALLLLLSLAGLASAAGCGASVAALRGQAAATAPNPQLGAVIDKEAGFSTRVKTPESAKQVEAARLGLLEAGVFSEEDQENLIPDAPITRAEFISLIVRAMTKDASGVKENSLPECWYAPYVRASYEAGLFGTDPKEMTFTPTDGFLMAEQGFAQMDLPICRADAAYILERASTERQMMGPLEDGAFHGEGYVSQASALVYAWKVHTGVRPQQAASTLQARPVDELLTECRTIIHSGGNIRRSDGETFTYSNAAEALVAAYRAGNRVMEFDFCWTEDGHLACIHKWQTKYSDGVTEGQALSLADWLDVRIYKEFTPLCLESLGAFMQQHPDLYVVTDVKENNVAAARLISELFPDLLDRFVIQIYWDEEYAAVSEMGFPNIIYTLYNREIEDMRDTDHWVEFAGEHELLAYTYPLEWFERGDYHQRMLECGIPLYVHTVNDPRQIQSCYAAKVAAVYTDEIE